MPDIFACIGCPFDDPDYGCLRDHDWQCPQDEFAFEEGGDQDV